MCCWKELLRAMLSDDVPGNLFLIVSTGAYVEASTCSLIFVMLQPGAWYWLVELISYSLLFLCMHAHNNISSILHVCVWCGETLLHSVVSVLLSLASVPISAGAYLSCFLVARKPPLAVRFSIILV